MVYSNGRDDFVCSQDEEEKCMPPKWGQKKWPVAREIHWEGQVVLVSKTSYL